MRAICRTLLFTLSALLASCAHGPVGPGPVEILVFGPHPDDAAIGCTGVMVKALARGERVGVVVVTNGDGYVKAAAQVAGKPEFELAPADFFRIARIRQRQSRTALSRIGIRAGDHHFLGFPDGGMAGMREMGNQAYRQKYTGKDRTYGALFEDYASRVHGTPAPYTWEAAVRLVAGILRACRPREIYVTNAGDRHPDHRASFFLVRDAIRASGYDGRFYTYLVHGANAEPPDEPERRPLSPDLVAFKREILREYAKNLGDVHDDLHLRAGPTETFWPVKTE